MRLLFLGDVVGRPGRRALAALLPRLAAREHLDFVVANCENASGGKGIDPRSADELHEAGVDVQILARPTSCTKRASTCSRPATTSGSTATSSRTCASRGGFSARSTFRPASPA